MEKIRKFSKKIESKTHVFSKRIESLKKNTTHFQFLNNITHFFTHTYFKNYK